MTRLTAFLIVAALCVAHQDFWYWRETRPLVFGFLPIGLFYHAAFTVSMSVGMWILVRLVWPAHLEDQTSARE